MLVQQVLDVCPFAAARFDWQLHLNPSTLTTLRRRQRLHRNHEFPLESMFTEWFSFSLRFAIVSR